MRKIVKASPALILAALTSCVGIRSDASSKGFRDCADCPDLTVIPAGGAVVGSTDSEAGRFPDEGPTHTLTIARSFAMMTKPLTVAEFGQFARETGFTPSGPCNHWDEKGEWKSSATLNWSQPGFPQSPMHPVVCVSWRDGQRYAQWLSGKTGERYRYLSEGEFEYARRAGSSSAFPWGSSGDTFCSFANGFDKSAGRLHPDWGEQPCDDGFAFTSPIGSFPANRFGLLDMSGNAFQWVQDCFVEGGYADAPTDGSAVERTPCVVRVIRGGSWTNGPRGLRSAMRDRDPEDSRYSNIGIRLARELDQ